MSRKRRKSNGLDAKNVLPAATATPDRFFPFFPIHQPAYSSYDQSTVTARARYLMATMPEIRMAIATMRGLIGCITPRPASRDEAWNTRARAAFMRRANNPLTFDVRGRYNFRTAQNWVEERCLVDGDCLTILAKGQDGGGQIVIYPGSQIIPTRDGDGVELDQAGRIVSYNLQINNSGETRRVPANNAILYSHTSNSDALGVRGISSLLGAILTAQDLSEINSYNKAAVKTAAAIALVETQSVGTQGVSDLKSLRNPSFAKKEQKNEPEPLMVGGVKAMTLSPGHDIKTLHDTRPSNETRQFARDLVDSIAYSVGLDSCMLYRMESMGSASARLSIAKSKDWAQEKLEMRKIWANRIYQHIISAEIAAGRLEPCPDEENQYNVVWINRVNWSIDLGRDANSTINLVKAGLCDPNDWALSNYDKTIEEIAAQNIHDITHIREMAKEAGVPVELLISNYPTQEGDSSGIAPLPNNSENQTQNQRNQ